MGAVAGLVLFLLAPPPLQGPQTAPAPHSHEPYLVPESERASLARFVEALSLSATLKDAIWAGFDLNALPIAVFRPGASAFVAGHPKPPHAFQTLAPEGIAGDRAVYRAPATSEMRSNATVQLDGQLFSTIDARSIDPPVFPEDAAGLVVHEGFHNFVRRSGGERFLENPLDAADFPDLDARTNADAAIEGLLLWEALRSHDLERAKARARQFLAVRAARTAALGPRFSAWEDRVEWYEGLATYAESRAVVLAASAAAIPSAPLRAVEPAFDRYPAAASYLERRFLDLSSARPHPGRARVRLYLTGAVQGLLLDRLGVEWKGEALSRGTPPRAALSAALEFDAARSESLAAAARTELGHGALLASETRAVIDAEAARLADAEAAIASDDVVVRVDASALGTPAECLQLDASSLVRLRGGKTLHRRNLRLRFPGSGSGVFTRPVIEDPAAALYRVPASSAAIRITASGEAIPFAAGLSRDAAKGVRVSSTGVTIDAALADLRVEETAGKRTLVVRLLPEPPAPR